MTSSYRGYARASDNLNSGKVIDPSQKILQRNKEFLEDYRRVREFERMQEADAFQQYQKNTQTETNSQVQSADLRAEYGQLVSNQQQANVQKKQAAMQMAFDRKAKEPSDWDKTLKTTKALVNLSTTADKLYGDYKKAKETEQIQQYRKDNADEVTTIQERILGTVPDAPPPTAPVTAASYTGQKAQTDGAFISATSSSALSAVEEAGGNLGSALEGEKNAGLTMSGVVNPIKQKLMVRQSFGARLQGFNGTVLNDRGEDVPYQNLNTADKSKYYAEAKAKVLLNMGIDTRGMDENVKFDLIKTADEASLPIFAAATRSELNTARSNAVDNARIMFQEDPSPINVEGLYMTLQRQAGGDDRAARDKLFDEFKSFNYDSTDVQTFLKAKVPGLNKSWEEQFPGDAQELLKARSATGIRNAEAEDHARELVDIQRAQAIDEQAITDLEDGVYNGASNEELAEKIRYYKSLGDDKTVEALTRLVSSTPSALNDARVEAQFDELLVNGVQGDLTPKMVLESGMSNEKKTEWLAKVKEFDATSPNQASMDSAKTFISDSIKSRAKFNEFTAKVKDPSINRAIDSALVQYQADYKQAMIGGKTSSEAKDYALGRFQQEFGDNEYNGRYRVGDPKTGMPDNVNRSFIDSSFTVQERTDDYSYNSASLNRALTVPDAINQPGLIPHEVLKDVSVQSLTKKGMPPIVTHIAARSNKPAFEILNSQLKANGLAEIPQAVYTAATEAQNVVTGDLQHLLNQYPTPTRTDIAMIGSGQQAIYSQLQPTQRRGLDILAKYESGKWGYDAMNEGGSDEGRKAHGSGSSVIKLGKSFTKMTIAEVMEHHAAGRLHAAGRYQFVAATFKEQVQKLGIPPTALFNEEMQDYMASEYAKQVGWRGVWIGPTDNAGPQEQAVLDAMSAADTPGVPPWRQPRNMNPSVVAMTVRTKEQGPGSGYWKWDEQRNLWVKSNAN